MSQILNIRLRRHVEKVNAGCIAAPDAYYSNVRLNELSVCNRPCLVSRRWPAWYHQVRSARCTTWLINPDKCASNALFHGRMLRVPVEGVGTVLREAAPQRAQPHSGVRGAGTKARTRRLRAVPFKKRIRRTQLHLTTTIESP